MKRRQALTAAAFGVGGAALAACGGRRDTPSQGASSVTGGRHPRVRWRMATSWPESLDIIYGGAVTIAERVRQMSDGYFDITPHAAGELVPALQVLDAVQQGSVECGHTATYYYIGKDPAFAFGTAIPFGLNAQQQNAWLYEGGGNGAMDRLFEDFGVLGFPAGNSGPQMGGWFKQQVNTVADLQGLKMRIPGLGGQVMAALGVNVQVLPGGRFSWPWSGAPLTRQSGLAPTMMRNWACGRRQSIITTQVGTTRAPVSTLLSIEGLGKNCPRPTSTCFGRQHVRPIYKCWPATTIATVKLWGHWWPRVLPWSPLAGRFWM